MLNWALFLFPHHLQIFTGEILFAISEGYENCHAIKLGHDKRIYLVFMSDLAKSLVTHKVDAYVRWGEGGERKKSLNLLCIATAIVNTRRMFISLSLSIELNKLILVIFSKIVFFLN